MDLGPRSYDILIGHGLLRAAHDWLITQTALHHAVMVADTNTQSYATVLAQQLDQAKIAHVTMLLPAGEKSKSIETLSHIWDRMWSFHADRRSTVVAVGGGVVGDLGGFAAATYARGIPYIQVPTSLLAQVDSSVGGKTGINLPAAKNMVGAFWQPQLVVADLEALTTLPRREFVSGLAEVVKYGMIADLSLFEKLEQQAASLNPVTTELAHIVERCVQIKAMIVGADERESSGIRAILNYGHTIGHALEITCGLGRLLHGEAIAIGMHGAARIAAARGMLAAEVVNRQQRLIEALGLPSRPPTVDLDQVWETITHDKKVDGNQVRFVLPTAIGAVRLVAGIQHQEVTAALANADDDRA